MLSSSPDKSNGFRPTNISTTSMLWSKALRTFRRESADNARNSFGLRPPGTISKRSLTKHINEQCSLKNNSTSSGPSNMASPCKVFSASNWTDMVQYSHVFIQDLYIRECGSYG